MVNRVVTIHKSVQQIYRHHGSMCTTKPVLKGRLVAAPVKGLGYRTATQHGVTNDKCEFTYRQGEHVTFFIGAADFPSACAGPTVTPYDMGTSPHVPINVVRLLHSLCNECNGTLSISASLEHLATAPINFSVDPHTFARQPAVAKMVKSLGCKLIDEDTAADLLDAMIAKWVYEAYQ